MQFFPQLTFMAMPGTMPGMTMSMMQPQAQVQQLQQFQQQQQLHQQLQQMQQLQQQQLQQQQLYEGFMGMGRPIL